MAGERRFGNRRPLSAKAQVEWNNPAQQTIQVLGDVADLSDSGARLHLDRPVPVNTSIHLAAGSQKRKCTVRYCVKRIRGYAIGVSFDPS
jgi:hypothetical protein